MKYDLFFIYHTIWRDFQFLVFYSVSDSLIQYKSGAPEGAVFFIEKAWIYSMPRRSLSPSVMVGWV